MCLRGFPGPSLYLATTPPGRGGGRPRGGEKGDRGRERVWIKRKGEGERRGKWTRKEGDVGEQEGETKKFREMQRQNGGGERMGGRQSGRS